MKDAREQTATTDEWSRERSEERRERGEERR